MTDNNVKRTHYLRWKVCFEQEKCKLPILLLKELNKVQEVAICMNAMGKRLYVCPIWCEELNGIEQLNRGDEVERFEMSVEVGLHTLGRALGFARNVIRSLR